MREIYKLWRPTPLYRAHRLERELDTPAHIYYKYEGTSPAGLAQAQHRGAAGLLQPRGGRAQARDRDRRGPVGLGARVRLPADGHGVRGVHGRLELRPEALPPLDDGGVGRDRAPQPVRTRPRPGRAQASHPTGSLGIAISEAVEVAAGDEGTNYALGSVLNHVLLHQTVVGQESVAQMEKAGEYPDVVIGCVGGGSNFAGITAPFVRANLRDGKQHALRGRRAGRLPDPHARRVPLRLRRHDGHDAADADVHARPRLRAAAGARRRPALPRRRAARVRPRARRAWSRRARSARTRPSTPPCASRAPRASFPRPSPRTRSAP